MIQCALNGDYGPDDHPEVPVSLEQLGRARDLESRASGVDRCDLHPRRPADAIESLAAESHDAVENGPISRPQRDTITKLVARVRATREERQQLGELEQYRQPTERVEAIRGELHRAKPFRSALNCAPTSPPRHRTSQASSGPGPSAPKSAPSGTAERSSSRTTGSVSPLTSLQTTMDLGLAQE